MPERFFGAGFLSFLNRRQSIAIHSIAQPPFKTGISIDSPDRPHTLQTLASCSPLPEEVPCPYNDRSGFQCLTGDRS
ncbi:hypothetical protein [Microcoleus sp. PH2017_05_CCC_O_A]|uniref:hypothetical protein n=1 Tax=Microcoleus sp. PH2017_05_CCC_O_A TaxID=2798816 RepID=UPI001D6E6566|nr:hypothetical protein [Microcoleus sp. PH2017_05_CCC_O_A]MCC3437973.1 hypothetical protein [Microcoleus sp. PH2017_05_CCC_O_A]